MNLKHHNPQRSIQAFVVWREYARRELGNFVAEFPEKLDGFRMQTSSTSSYGGPGYSLDTVRLLPNGKFSIDRRSPYHGWESEIKIEDRGLFSKGGYSSAEIAQEIILPDYDRDGVVLSQVYSNRERNLFLRELEKQTGFDLKRAVRNKYPRICANMREEKEPRFIFLKRLFGLS